MNANRISKVSLIAFLQFAVMCALHAADVSALIREGDGLDAERKNAEALELYLEAERAEPRNAEILHRISKQYGLSMEDVTDKAEKQERGETALNYALRAAAADPKNAQAQLALAVCYGRLAGLMDNRTKIAYSKKVQEHAERSLALDASSDLTHHVLGAWNLELANLNPILRAIASALYGKIPKASNEAALAYFEQAIALNPRRIGNHVEIGRVYAAMGRDAEARAAIEKGLALPIREKDDEEAVRRGKAELKRL